MIRYNVWLIIIGVIGGCLMWARPSQAMSNQIGFSVADTQISTSPVAPPEIPAQGQLIHYREHSTSTNPLPQLSVKATWLWIMIGLELVIFVWLMLINRHLAWARKVGDQ